MVYHQLSARPIISMDARAERRELIARDQPVAVDGGDPVNGIPLRYRLEHSRPPRTLEAHELPGVLEHPPIVCVRLRYATFAQLDEQGRTYVLCSVGADGVDDGGRVYAGPEAPGLDDRIAPLQGREDYAGFDAVANPGARAVEIPK